MTIVRATSSQRLGLLAADCCWAAAQSDRARVPGEWLWLEPWCGSSGGMIWWGVDCVPVLVPVRCQLM